uniref:mitochondrial coenzyme A diphosphatase NUDT8-like isoform X1 n=1 Tax=Myxine glutinosa TaxID=7769 RepID=UPI00358E16EF
MTLYGLNRGIFDVYRLMLAYGTPGLTCIRGTAHCDATNALPGKLRQFISARESNPNDSCVLKRDAARENKTSSTSPHHFSYIIGDLKVPGPWMRMLGLRAPKATLQKLCSASRPFCSMELSSVGSIATCFGLDNQQRCVLELRRHKEEAEQRVADAAVLVPLCCVEGQPSVLLTIRSHKLLGSHQGQISFPGGMRDSSDADSVHTALRETREELGIDVPRTNIWGLLPALHSGSSKKLVRPVIGFVGEVNIDSLRPCPDEVEQAFALTLSQVCSPQNQRYTHFRRHGRFAFTLPIFNGGPGQRVWGFTGIVLHQTLCLLLPKAYCPIWGQRKRGRPWTVMTKK